MANIYQRSLCTHVRLILKRDFEGINELNQYLKGHLITSLGLSDALTNCPLPNLKQL